MNNEAENEIRRHEAKHEFEKDIQFLTKYNKKQQKTDSLSIEGQIIASFALGVIFGAYTYSILFLILFFIIYELIFFIIYQRWPIKLRVSIIIAYIIGILIGCYCARVDYPGFFW